MQEIVLIDFDSRILEYYPDCQFPLDHTWIYFDDEKFSPQLSCNNHFLKEKTQVTFRTTLYLTRILSTETNTSL